MEMRLRKDMWTRSKAVRLGLALVLAIFATTGCATVAELRKVEARVMDMERGRAPGGGALREQVADYVADIDTLREEMRTLEGRLEVTEKAAADALEDARRARLDLAQMKAQLQRGETPTGVSSDSSDASESPAAATAAASVGVLPGDGEEDLSTEIQAYRAAHTAWQKEDTGTCVERFREFLQTYPESPYADDAAFWMADCHYKQAEYKKAVLRFDEVVRNYPAGNKASDALYRQGESLLKLGPGFREAAKRAFERVIKEYPDSERASEARRQLDLY